MSFRFWNVVISKLEFIYNSRGKLNVLIASPFSGFFHLMLNFSGIIKILLIFLLQITIDRIFSGDVSISMFSQRKFNTIAIIICSRCCENQRKLQRQQSQTSSNRPDSLKQRSRKIFNFATQFLPETRNTSDSVSRTIYFGIRLKSGEHKKWFSPRIE